MPDISNDFIKETATFLGVLLGALGYAQGNSWLLWIGVALFVAGYGMAIQQSL